nr:transposase [Deinococcus sp. RM]
MQAQQHDVVELTDQHWHIVAPLFSDPPRRIDGKGRPRAPSRPILNAVLWIVRTGAPWKDLPAHYPPRYTVHRRFQEWVRSGVLDRALQALYELLADQGQLNLSECYIDATFASAKKGAWTSAKPSEAKARRSWRSRTPAACPSRFMSPAPAHMRSRSCTTRLTRPSALTTQNG